MPKAFADEYDRILCLGEAENPLLAKIEGKRIKRGKARCLLDRFIKFRTEVTRFADDFSAPFDNNQAERDIRIVKVKQKVSGGFRKDDAAANFGKISSIIGTAVKQGKSAFKTISGLLSGSITFVFTHADNGTE